jgi:prepilin-type processing-associated H-X9-DG protein
LDNNDECVRNGDPGGMFLFETNNWNSNVMTWDTTPGNTNLQLFRTSLLSPFFGLAPEILKCPSENYLSRVQKSAGWTTRLRSYSMNAYVGHARKDRPDGYSGFAERMQKTSAVRGPAKTFLTLDVHPDSIWMPWYLIDANPTYTQWFWMPAAHHSSAGAFSFVDGHAELHRWRVRSTMRPVAFAQWYGVAVSDATRGDFVWVSQRATGK